MKQAPNNYAFIDGANLYNGVKEQGWLIDYKRLRKWLADKLDVQNAYLFIGLMPKNSDMYRSLQEAGYILIFKPTVTDPDGRVKGNCDADMVLHIVSNTYEDKFDQAVLITSDGDFYSTVEFLKKRDKLKRLLSPSPNCSILLKRLGVGITYLHDIKPLIEYKKKKPPMKTKHHQGSFRSNPAPNVAKTTKKVNKPRG